MVGNKKAVVVGDFLTWFGSFIIIVFLSLALVGVTSLFAAQKSMPGLGEGRDEIKLDESNIGNLDSQRMLMKYLATYVEYDGEQVKMRDLISEVLEEKDEKLEQFILEKSKEILNESCRDFVLKIPGVGVIRASEDKYLEGKSFDEVSNKLFSPAVRLKVLLEDNVFEVRFRKLREC